MQTHVIRLIGICLLSLLPFATVLGGESNKKTKIVLVAGETAKIDTVGHHDYIAGCKCLATMLELSDRITTVQVQDGWPQDVSVFDNAKSVVFYTDGGGKQAFFENPERMAVVQKMVDSGVGIVMIHQAVDVPAVHADRTKNWIGGIYLQGPSARGHWPSNHVDFPEHPVTRGVTAWQVNDGWLNRIQFVDGMTGVTPMVWSGKEYAGSRAGLDADIVGWVYERPHGGRSFSFTGLDAHSAWSLQGMRQLVVNGILWTAGEEIPLAGAPNTIQADQLDSMLTPREPKKAAKPKAVKDAPNPEQSVP